MGHRAGVGGTGLKLMAPQVTAIAPKGGCPLAARPKRWMIDNLDPNQ
jgi:hypothetical protein